MRGFLVCQRLGHLVRLLARHAILLLLAIEGGRLVG